LTSWLSPMPTMLPAVTWQVVRKTLESHMTSELPQSGGPAFHATTRGILGSAGGGSCGIGGLIKWRKRGLGAGDSIRDGGLGGGLGCGGLRGGGLRGGGSGCGGGGGRGEGVGGVTGLDRRARRSSASRRMVMMVSSALGGARTVGSVRPATSVDCEETKASVNPPSAPPTSLATTTRASRSGVFAAGRKGGCSPRVCATAAGVVQRARRRRSTSRRWSATGARWPSIKERVFLSPPHTNCPIPGCSY
jgi:hypothetical protein